MDEVNVITASIIRSSRGNAHLLSMITGRHFTCCLSRLTKNQGDFHKTLKELKEESMYMEANMGDDIKKDFYESYEGFLQGEKDSLGGNKEWEDAFDAISSKDKKLMWLSSDFFSLITYDSSLDYKFGNVIYEAMLKILNREAFEYIKEENNYTNFILVCNLLKSHRMIDWGTSIRGAWFDFSEDRTQGKNSPMIDYVMKSEENMKWFLNEFIV